MKVESLKFSNIIVALPIIQISCASLFLAAYCFGFGAGIYGFLSATDIFTATIGSVVPAYIIYLIMPGLVAWNSIHRPTAEDQIRAIQDENARQKAITKINQSRNIIFLLLCLFLISTIALQFYRILNRKDIIIILLFMQLFLFSVMFIYSNQDRLKLNRASTEILVLISSTIIGLATLGLDQGRSDRHLSYSVAMASRPHCGQYAVIRKMSELYLVVAPGDSKALIDDKCQLRFSIPMPTRPH